MSIISQNVLHTNKTIKVNGEETDELLVQEGNEGTMVAKESSLVGSKSKKRKKEVSEREKESNIKQEKEMKRLENFLFGSLYSPVVFGKEEEEEAKEALIMTDRSGIRNMESNEEGVEFREESSDEMEIRDRKPAWVDDEEMKTNIDIAKLNRLRKLRKDEKETSILGSDYVERLRAHHVKLNPGTEWAQAGPWSGDGSDAENEAGVGDKDTDGNDDILRTNEDIVVKGGVKLLPGLLEFSKLVDANAEDPSNGPINSVQFHRNAQLLLTAGLDRRLRFFQIDGKRNTKIQSIFLEDCPIRKASFLPDGSQVIAAGRRKFFYSFDLVKAKVDKIGPLTGREEKSLEVFEVSPDSSTIAFVGNEGYILLVSSRTKELIGTMKMNGTARSLAFADDGRQLLSSGGDGHVYHWDLRTRACFHKAVDEGCINGSSLSTSPNGFLFAAGSGSGIVNIYNRGEFLGGKRRPVKTVENITTKVDFVKFNHDSQILAICSSMQKNSLKLVHIPSFSVFSNWPPANRTLHFPRCLDFSPGGGFMAVGNAAGKVLLYKLHHYPHA
ncbi:WD40 repeat [Macleaya cordata]|uniref:U3 small nucleolar RNA-associated protein 18 homolog n=1 Tax=Macleaya cordata TaxID=56857 RepID=A0A200QRD5_MACCD|nr:WD40 repeat [Macleaya cordata]